MITEEKAETGNVKIAVILAYCRACTYLMTFLTLLFYVLTNGASVASNFWLAEWSNAEGNEHTSETHNGTSFVKVTACDKQNGPDVYVSKYIVMHASPPPPSLSLSLHLLSKDTTCDYSVHVYAHLQLI